MVRHILPPKHSFRRLKNYYQVWPYEDFNEDWWGPEVARLAPDVQTWPVVPPTVQNHPAAKYLGSRSHDARVFQVSPKERSLEFTVDDYQVWRLARAVQDRIGGNDELRFSATLRFDDIIAWVALQDSPNGDLHLLKHSLSKNLASVHEFYRDRVSRWDEDRFIGFIHFFVQPARHTVISRSKGWPHSALLHEHGLVLAIDAKCLSVQESQKIEWQRIFGEQFVEIFDVFWSLRDSFVRQEDLAFEEFVEGWF